MASKEDPGKAITSEERTVLEEAIGAVQDVSQILTEVVMINPLAALSGAGGSDGVEPSDDSKDSES